MWAYSGPPEPSASLPPWPHPSAHTPMVTTPPLPGKNRPCSRGPERQGVTPAILVGALRDRPSSCSLFTQPPNPEDTWGESRWGWVRGSRGFGQLGWDMALGWGRSSHRELWAKAAGWETPDKDGLELGVPVGPLLAPGPGPVHLQLDPTLLPVHRHLRGEREAGQPVIPRDPASSSPLSWHSPCATGQPGHAGGSALGAGARGLGSER